MMRKNIIFCAAIVVAVAVSVLWREELSRLLGGEMGRIVPPAPQEQSIKMEQPSPPPSPVNKGEAQPSFLSPPSYTGRDLQEVRPVPEEVKLFSNAQKNQIFADIGNYGDAVKKNPEFFFGWIQVGLLKKVIGDYEGARDAWEYASLIRPKNSVSFANLGELYWRYLFDFARAEANFRISIKNKPDDVSTYLSLSDLYYFSYREKVEFTDDVLHEGLAANPEDTTLLKATAHHYARVGNYPEAIAWWKRALAKEPTNTAVAAEIQALEQKLGSGASK